MQIRFSLLFLLVISLSSIHTVQAQKEDSNRPYYRFKGFNTNLESRDLAKGYFDTLLNTLKQEGLVVALPSFNQKIKSLEEGIQEAKDNGQPNKYLEKLLRKTIEDRDRLHKIIPEVLAEQYNATKVYFVLDTALQVMSKGVKDGIVLDENMQINNNLSLPYSPMPYIWMGYSDNHVEGLILSFGAGEFMTKFDNIGYFFARSVSHDLAERNRYKRVFKKLNRAIGSFLELAVFVPAKP